MGRNRPACKGEATTIITTPQPVPLNFSSLRGERTEVGSGAERGWVPALVRHAPTGVSGGKEAELRSAAPPQWARPVVRCASPPWRGSDGRNPAKSLLPRQQEGHALPRFSPPLAITCCTGRDSFPSRPRSGVVSA
jgi:hypothetical protein